MFLGTLLSALALPSLKPTLETDPLKLFLAAFLVPLDPAWVKGTGAPILIVAWTLQYEMVFYAFFAVLILNKRAAWIGIAAFVSLYAINHVHPFTSFLLRFFTHDYVWLFLFGMLTSELCHRFKPGRWSVPILITGLSINLILLTFSVFESSAALFGGLGSALIVFGLVQAERVGTVFLGGRCWQLLGGSSYALYLIHFPLISVLCKIACSSGLKSLGFTGVCIAYFLIFSICIGVSVLFHLMIEKPIAAYVKKNQPKAIQPIGRPIEIGCP